LIILLLSTKSAFGVVIKIPADYPSIGSGIEVAQSGDTVLVAPGEYIENIAWSGRNIYVISEEGPESTILRSADTGRFTVVMGSEYNEFSGFTLAGGSNLAAIYMYNGIEAIVSNNIFCGFTEGYVIRCRCEGLISRNLFYDNSVACILLERATTTVISNNTFDNNGVAVSSPYGAGIVKNNVFMNGFECAIKITYDTVGIYDYNCYWNNTVDFCDIIRFGQHSIFTDPQYINPMNRDYRFIPSSPCIDGGDPDPVYNDPDGSRCDIGAFPYSVCCPRVFHISYIPDSADHVVSQNPTISWKYFDPERTQNAFEIEVGIDSDWTVAEMWHSGQIYTSNAFAIYDGLPLVDGQIYYLRLRAFNGDNWCDWIEDSLRMNSPPTEPILMWPIDGMSTNSFIFNLWINNSIDFEGDEITYDFQLYADPSMIDKIQWYENVPEQNTTTGFGPITDLSLGETFWWRVRAYDGFEYSAWTELTSFSSTGGNIIRIPEDEPTIQEGINSSVSGDMVLLSPGSYHENVICLGKNIRIVGENGAGETFLMPPDSTIPAISMSPGIGSELNGITITGGAGEELFSSLGGGTILIKNCIFSNFSGQGENSAVVRVSSNSFVANNLFYDNSGFGCVFLENGSTSRIINNTFDRNSGGINSSSNKTIVMNNIITRSANFGLQGVFEERKYNCLWNNKYSILSEDGVEEDLDAYDIDKDPCFVYHYTGDYRLRPESPCIDTGDPDSVYCDLDGSRNDMGAFPLDFRYPITVDFNYGQGATGDIVPTLSPVFFWTYRDTILSNQHMYEVEVGTDNDWHLAEMWSTGSVQSTDTSASYMGIPLSDHTIYVVRIRVHNGIEWGDWITRTFTTREEISNSSWPMHQGNAVHTGVNPYDKIKPPLARKWSVKLTDLPLSPATVGQNRVLAVPWRNNYPHGELWCLDATNGDIQWQWDYGNVASMVQPSYAYGYVYNVVVDNPSYIQALDVHSGEIVWQSPYSNQWFTSLAPTIYNGLVSFCGHYYGGIHTFDAITGELAWDRGMGGINLLEDGWTPAIYHDQVFVFVPGWLYVFDSKDGDFLWSINLVGKNESNKEPALGCHRFTAPVIDSVHNTLYMSGATTFHVVDINSRELIWDILGGNFWTTPVVFEGIVYTIHDGILKAYDGITGDSIWSFTCPELFLSGYPADGPAEYSPIVANGCLFVSSAEKVYAIDLTTKNLVWEYHVSGFLSICNEQLFVSSYNGFLYAFGNIPTNSNDIPDPAIPQEAALNQNYPNPFNASTRIDYSLPRAGNITITVYNILGETIRELVDEYRPAGEYMVIWNGKDDHNINVASGIYIYRLEVNNHAETKTMLLLK
jgi:hypothetical protein